MWHKLLVILTVMCSCVFGSVPEYNEDSEDLYTAKTIKYDHRGEHVFYNVETDLIYKYQTEEGQSNDGFNTSQVGSERTGHTEVETPFQPWSILWYAGSFGGLIAFFLVVSCSEWCCRAHARNTTMANAAAASTNPNETPPPAYDLFAPPSYESLCSPNEKRDFDVFVVPVDSLRENNADLSNLPQIFATNARSSSEEVVINIASAENEFLARQKEVRESATQT